MKYKVDRNEPLPTGEPVEKLAEEKEEGERMKTSSSSS
jgi:hypothetical protein